MPEVTNPFDATLTKLLQERAELDSLIAALQKRAGKPVTVPLGDLMRTGAAESTGVSTPVYRGEFFNLSITKAAEKALKRAGIPLKTPQIMEMFDQAGFEIKSKTPRASIYTALARSREFVKVLPDTWDLSERHPEAAAQKEQELRNTRASKGKKKRKSAKAEAASEKPKSEGIKSVA